MSSMFILAELRLRDRRCRLVQCLFRICRAVPVTDYACLPGLTQAQAGTALVQVTARTTAGTACRSD